MGWNDVVLHDCGSVSSVKLMVNESSFLMETHIAVMSFACDSS